MSVYNVLGCRSLHIEEKSGNIDEANENRNVKNKVIELLSAAGHTVYDCTDDIGRTQGQNLNNIKKKCNSHQADLNIAIEINREDDYKTSGVEVLNLNKETSQISDRVCNGIATTLGIENRGSLYTDEMYILNNTDAAAIIIKCCLVTSKVRYDKWDANKCAQAIVDSILDKNKKSFTEKPVKQSNIKQIDKPTYNKDSIRR